MTVTVTSPAPPDEIGRQHRVRAIGFGFGGLTAAKVLKHAQLNITDALVFLVRITAQGTSRLVNQPSPWLQVIPTTTAVAIAMGVLIALTVAAVGKGSKYVVAQTGSFSAPQIDYAAIALTPYGLRRSRPIAKGWL